MKRILLLLLAMITIGSLYCQGKSKPTPLATPVTPQKPSRAMMSASEREAFLKMTAGEWLKQAYYDELIKTKSPMQALKTDGEWPCFTIKDKSSNPNEFYVSNEHRFDEFREAYIPYEKRDSLVFISDFGRWHFKLKFLPDDKNVAYWSEDYSVKMDKYIRIANMDSLLNSVVIAGTYLDYTFTPAKEIRFNPDGTVTGLDLFSKYKVIMDCGYARYDQILANNDLYFIEMKANNLSIYHAKRDYYGDGSDEYDWIKGGLLYTFSKKK